MLSQLDGKAGWQPVTEPLDSALFSVSFLTVTLAKLGFYHEMRNWWLGEEEMVHNPSSPFKTESSKWFICVKEQIKPPYCFCKNKVWNLKDPVWSSCVSIPSPLHTFQTVIIYSYKSAHLKFASKYFKKGYFVLEKACDTAALEKMLTGLGSVVGWRQQECGSLGICLLPLAGVLLSETKAKLHQSSKRLLRHMNGKKRVNQVVCEILNQNPSLTASSQQWWCLCSVNPVLDSSQAFELFSSALDIDKGKQQCWRWRGGSCAFLCWYMALFQWSARQM